MGTLQNAQDRTQVLTRLRKLTAETSPQWGTMNCPKMLAHLSDALRMTYGDLEVPEKRMIFRYFPIKQLVLYVIPFPKGAPTAPQLISRTPEGSVAFDKELTDLTGLVERFERESNRTDWPNHPVFGPLSAKGWGTLGYRHIDHHLRQFGV